MSEISLAVASFEVPVVHDLDDDSKEAEETAIALGPQERLGRSLQDKREVLGKSLDEIVRITKIPKASLGHIEAGRFDRLPGDVFARGFLRSYARCLELDGDEIVRRYAQCGLRPAPVSSPLADAVLGGRRKPSQRRARGTVRGGKSPVETNAPVDAFDLASPRTEGSSEEKSSSEGNPVKNVLRDAFDLTMQLRGDRKVDKKKSEAAKVVEAPENVARNHSEEACPSTRERKTRTFIPPVLPSENDMTHRGPLTLGVIILVIVATLTMSYLLRRPGTSTDGFTMSHPALFDGADLERSVHETGADMQA